MKAGAGLPSRALIQRMERADGRRNPNEGATAKAVAPSFGASDEARTRYLHLGKVALYQMSYTRTIASMILAGTHPLVKGEIAAGSRILKYSGPFLDCPADLEI